MVRRQILPTALSYIHELTDAVVSKQAAVPGLSCAVETETILQLTALAEGLHGGAALLERSLDQLPESITEQAAYYHDTVLSHMDALRRDADLLETLIPAQRWPFPTYAQLLFSE